MAIKSNQSILKLEISDYTKSEIKNKYGQDITHAEVHIENNKEWEKHEDVILPELKWYCKFHEFTEDFKSDMSGAGLMAYIGGNHVAFHDINGTRDRFAMFVLTNGTTYTL